MLIKKKIYKIVGSKTRQYWKLIEKNNGFKEKKILNIYEMIKNYKFWTFKEN